jgi:hypothetical protein
LIRKRHKLSEIRIRFKDFKEAEATLNAIRSYCHKSGICSVELGGPGQRDEVNMVLKHENDEETNKHITGVTNELIHRKCRMCEDTDGHQLSIEKCLTLDILKRRVGLCPKTRNSIKNSLIFVGLIYGVTLLTAGPFSEFVTLQQETNENTVDDPVTAQWEDALLRGAFYATFPTLAALLAEWLKHR